MEKEEINNIIIEILGNNGDGHIDAEEDITSFVMSLLKGEEKEWRDSYFEKTRKNKEKLSYFNQALLKIKGKKD